MSEREKESEEKRKKKTFILYLKLVMKDHVETMTFILKGEGLSSQLCFPYLHPI